MPATLLCILPTCYAAEVLEFCPSEAGHMSAKAEPYHVDIVEGQAEVLVQSLQQHRQLFAHKARVCCCSHVVGNQGPCFPVDTDYVALLLQEQELIRQSLTTVAARSTAQSASVQREVWMSVRVFLCCIVLCS